MVCGIISSNVYLDTEVSDVIHYLFVIKLILDIQGTLNSFPYNCYPIISMVFSRLLIKLKRTIVGYSRTINISSGACSTKVGSICLMVDAWPHDYHRVTHKLNYISSILAQRFDHSFHVSVYAKCQLFISSDSHQSACL